MAPRSAATPTDPIQRAAAVLLLVLLALAAGCEGPLADGSPEPTPSAPSEPPASASGPTTPTPAPATPPPGLTADGVTDPDRLATAHQRALAERSYAMDYRLEAFDPDGDSLGQFTTRATVAAGTARFSYVSARSGVFGDPAESHRQRLWGNRSVLLHSETFGSSPHFTRFDESVRSDVERIATRRGIVAFAFTLVDTEVVDVERRDGTVLYRLEAADGPHELDGRDVSLTATVEASGFVRSLTMSYRADDYGKDTRIVRTLRFEDVGEASVPRPDWVEAALVDTSPDGDGEPRGADGSARNAS